MKIFAVKDLKAEGYGTPFFQATYGLAERAFKEAAADPQSYISKNKEDFSLHLIGEFNSATGQIVPEATPKHVCNAM